MGKNKAAALASYAKQAGDETVHRYADRIKARAVRLGGGAGEADCASDRCSSKEGGRPPSFTLGRGQRRRHLLAPTQAGDPRRRTMNPSPPSALSSSHADAGSGTG